MARKKINYYKFTPGVSGVGTVQLPDQYTLDDILMITNVTKNTVIYNFGDPNRGAYNAASGGTGPVISFDGADTNTTFNASVTGYSSQFYNGVTTLFLRFDTSGHSANDVLQIYVESEELKIRTHDFGIDAVERQRVGIPRSMIDADFEYGLQSTKWASYTTYRQTPTTYAMDGTDFTVNSFSYATMIASETGQSASAASQTITGANSPSGTVNFNRAYTLLNQGNTYIAGPVNQVHSLGGVNGIIGNAAYPIIGTQVIYGAPVHNLGEYKLVINQPSGVTAGQSFGPTNATYITKNRPITAANGGQFQRTFGVASVAQLQVGDVVAAIGLPRFDQTNYATGLEVVATESFGFTSGTRTGGSIGTTLTFTTAGTSPSIRANTFLAVEVGGLNSNLYELVFVPAAVVSGTAITGALNVHGTNPGNTFVTGGRIYCLTPGGVTFGAAGSTVATPNSDTMIQTTVAGQFSQPYVINSMEMMRVDSINATTNELTVTRGWFGTNANVSFGPGTIIATVNLRPGFTYAQWLANVELFKVTGAGVNGLATGLASITTANSQVNAGTITNYPSTVGSSNPALTITGAVNYLDPSFPMLGFGMANISYTGTGMGATAGVRAGSFMVTLSGMFQAGNTSVPLTMISANNHTISQFSIANTGSYSASNVSNCWVSTIATTGSYNNANVEGVFFNQIADRDYIAFFPKNADASKYPGYPLIPPNEVAVIAPRFKRGGLYMGANLLHHVGNVQVTSNTAGIAGAVGVANILIRTQNPHGILPGTPIQVSLKGHLGRGATNGSSANVLATGVATVTHANLYYFSYLSKSVNGNPMDAAAATQAAAGTGTLTVNGNLAVYAFPTSQVKHRGLDGGTNIGINVPSYGFEATRQTRKYFRYQSGKGMMFTTGTQFNPVFSIANVTANVTAIGSSPAIKITTVNEHGLQRGANIKLYGLNTVGYNDYYFVNDVEGPYVFKVMAKTTLGGLNPNIQGANIADYQYNPRVTVTNWHGAKIRSGMFDDGNGVFWEYDGQYLWAVKRSATYELIGSVSVAPGDNRVVGDTNTRFRDNVKQGDQIQIRGMVHDVIHVESQNVLYITPGFRAVAPAVNASYALVREQRTRSALFNMDKLDGTGPSGYVIDLSKMQMVGIQYTWYGAGFIDWGMRTTDGRMIWAHRVKNNNRNDEGYMRSGNLPARYQAVNRGAITWLTTDVTAGDTTFRVANIDEFPSVSATYPGFGMIDNEIFSFTGVTRLNLSSATPTGTIDGITRAAEYKPVILNEARSIRGEVAGAHTANVSPVMLFSVTASPDLNHWGSAVILDGDFDIDRTYQFAYSVTNVTYAGTIGVPQTIFMIRLSPSIGSGIPADLGARDLLNRAQLLLQNCYVNLGNTGSRVLLQGIVNPVNVEWANWQNVNNAANQFAPSFTQFVSNVSPVTRGALDSGVNSHVSQIKWSGSVTSPAGAPGAFPVLPGGPAASNAQGPWVIPYAYGGEQLFSIPVSGTNSGFIDLSKVKEVGGTIVPGNQVYPNGPEIIAFNIVPLNSTASALDLQMTWIESQA